MCVCDLVRLPQQERERGEEGKARGGVGAVNKGRKEAGLGKGDLGESTYRIPLYSVRLRPCWDSDLGVECSEVAFFSEDQPGSASFYTIPFHPGPASIDQPSQVEVERF
jgi:hypothetical protein